MFYGVLYLVPGLMVADGVHLGYRGRKKYCPWSYLGSLTGLQSTFEVGGEW